MANGVHWVSKVISIGALAGLTTVVMVLMLGQCPDLVRHGAGRAIAAGVGEDRFSRHPGPDHLASCCGGGCYCGGVADSQARGDGQRWNIVCVRPDVVWGGYPAPNTAGPAVGVPCAVASDRIDLCLSLADAEFDRVDLDSVRCLAVSGNRNLRRIQISALGARPSKGSPDPPCQPDQT